jgi:peptidoglycan hydrolase-like protein with peptidoglycan-binding domain
MSLWSSENDPLAPVGGRRSNASSPGDILSSQLAEREPKSSGSDSPGGWFDLSAPVGRGAANRHQDVLKVESILGETGHYDVGKLQGPTGLWGQVADQAVKGFQKDNGLAPDGILNPGGPTIVTMKSQVGDIFKSWNPPSYQEVIDHHNDLADGGSGKLTFGRPPLQMARADGVDEETSNANRRTLDYLSAYGDNQGLDAAAAKHIASGDEAAIPRYRDLVWQMAEQDPKRAHGFAWGVLDNLSDDGMGKAFLGFEVPDHRPVGLRQDDWLKTMEFSLRPQTGDAGDNRNPDPEADSGPGQFLETQGGGDVNEGGSDSLDLRDEQADPLPEDRNNGSDEEPKRSEAPELVDEPPVTEEPKQSEEPLATKDDEQKAADSDENMKPEEPEPKPAKDEFQLADNTSRNSQEQQISEEEKMQQIKDALELAWREHDQLLKPITETQDEIERLKQEIAAIRARDPREYSSKEDYKEFTDTDSLLGRLGWKQIDKKYQGTLEHQMVGDLGLARQRLTEGELKQQIKEAEERLGKLEQQRSFARSAAVEYERRLRESRAKDKRL